MGVAEAGDREVVAYRIDFSPAARRDYNGLTTPIRRRLQKRIDALADDPRPRGVVKLSGSEDIYRVRVGDFRIIYEIQDAVLLIHVLKIGNRRDVYR